MISKLFFTALQLDVSSLIFLYYKFCLLIRRLKVSRVSSPNIYLLTLQDPPPRFSFHQRVFSTWSFPSSWSFRMAPFMAVLYGESEVPRSFWGTSLPHCFYRLAASYFRETFGSTVAPIVPSRQRFVAIPRAIASFIAAFSIDRYFRAVARSVRRPVIRFHSISRDEDNG